MPRKKKSSKLPKQLIDTSKKWWGNLSWWLRIAVIALLIIGIMVSTMYGVARWYIAKHADEPLVIGASFIPSYASYFGLDERETLRAMIDDLGLRRFRLVSYWNQGEPQPDEYYFDHLDWQFDMIEEAGGEVSLAIGLRQPRWPECHWPTWAHDLPKEQWQTELKEYMGKVVDRYKDRPSLTSYQLENEYFLDVFGDCPDHTRERLVDEFNYVKSIDPDKPLITTRSNNATPSWPINEPHSDINGASIYKRVWDRTLTKRYFEYPLPAWYYAFLAGGAELTTGRNTFIHEMQTEPWPPVPLVEASIEEQDKSLSADQLRGRINYGVATGMKTIDLWGVEWWYWRKAQLGDPSVWNEGKQAISDLQTKGTLE